MKILVIKCNYVQVNLRLYIIWVIPCLFFKQPICNMGYLKNKHDCNYMNASVIYRKK